MTARLVVEADGGSRGYPGIAAGGAVVIIDGRDVAFEWVPRAENVRADAAANTSMDMRGGFRRAADDGRSG